MNETIITVLVSSLTGIVTFFLGVSKTKKELEDMSLNNIKKSIDIYNRIIDDMRKQIDELTEEITQLRERVEELHTENQELKEMLKKK
jgi:peptidoglycan hydrolase CwlO-like protein